MIRIFLVDDHLVLRAGLRHLLSHEADMQVVGEAASGQLLLEQLPTVPADVIMLDLNMPGMSGLEIAQHVREHHPEARVLVLSLLDDEPTINALFDAGAWGYILKSAGFDEITHGLRLVAAGRFFVCAEVGYNAVRRLQVPKVLPASMPGSVQLSKREMEILQLLSQGMTNQGIADKLFTSKRTVETHRQHILEKTQMKNTASLIHFAMSNGLVA